MLRLLVVLWTVFPIFTLADEIYSIGAGSQSGLYYSLGGHLAKIWTENIKDINMRVEVTAASVENTIKVSNNTLLVGFAQGNVVQQAYYGEAGGVFGRHLPINVLAALYPNIVHIITTKSSGIKTIYDLDEKRVSVGAPGSGTAVTAESLLSALEIELGRIQYLSYTDTTDAIANGQIDAGFIVGGLGTGAIINLALMSDIEIISLSEKDIEKFITLNTAYTEVVVPSGIYKGVDDFTSIAVWNVLVVREDMDSDLAYEMVKLLYEHSPSLAKTIKVAEFIIPKNAKKLHTVPLHHSTIKYLTELEQD